MNEYGVILNIYDFKQEMEETDKLVLVYVFDSNHLNGKIGERIHFEMVLPAVKEMKGLIKVFAFDCAHPTMTPERLKMFPACDT